MYSRLGRWAETSQALSESMMFRRRFLFDSEEDDGVEARVMEFTSQVATEGGRSAESKRKRFCFSCIFFLGDIGVLVLLHQLLRNAILTVVILSTYSVQDMIERSGLVAARRILVPQAEHDKSTERSGGMIDREVTQQLFKTWVRSDDKDKASCVIS